MIELILVLLWLYACIYTGARNDRDLFIGLSVFLSMIVVWIVGASTYGYVPLSESTYLFVLNMVYIATSIAIIIWAAQSK